MSKKCLFCGRAISDYVNYCEGDCIILLAKAEGGRVIAPNGLRTKCVCADGTLLELEHGDHRDYQFPVDVEPQVISRETCEEYRALFPERVMSDKDVLHLECQTHALIYTDGCIAVTMYECDYAVWRLADGSFYAGHFWDMKDEWHLTDASREKIIAYAEKDLKNRWKRLSLRRWLTSLRSSVRLELRVRWQKFLNRVRASS